MTLAYMLSLGIVISGCTNKPPQQLVSTFSSPAKQSLTFSPGNEYLSLSSSKEYVKKSTDLVLDRAENTSKIAKSITKPVSSKVAKREPFFPFGFYYRLPPNPQQRIEALHNIADGGFNCIFVSWEKILDHYDSFLDEAERRDMQIITELRGADVYTVKSFKDKPATFGWGIADDAGDHQTHSEILAVHQKIKALAPQDYTYISVSGASRKWSKYANVADLIGGQYYPIGYPYPSRLTGLPNDLISVYHIFSAGRAEANKHQRPVIANLQTFRWHGTQRWPTSKEVYNMTYQALLAGVKGIIFYTYKDDQNSIIENPDLWASLKSLTPEIKQLTPVLLNGKLTEIKTNNPELLAGQWTYKNKIYLITINTSSIQAYPIALEVSRSTTIAQPLFPGRPAGLILRDGQMSGVIQPTDVHVYELSNP
jgi:hypothetical protein